MPWTSLSWELNQDARALETMKTTAKTLASRFSPEVGCIRSWDTCKTRKYDFRDTDSEFLVIIVSIAVTRSGTAWTTD